MDEAAKERREYVLDAWADVLVTTAFVIATLLVTALGHRVRHPSVVQHIALWAFEVGFTVAVVNHVLRMLWYRTVVGPLCKKIYRSRPKRRGGAGGRRRMDRRREAPNTDHQPPLPDVAAAVGPSADGGFRFALVHPAPGGAGARAAESFVLGFVGGVLTVVYLTLTRAGGEGLGAFVTALLVLIGVLFYPRLVIWWAALALLIALCFEHTYKKAQERERRYKRR